MKIFRMLSLSLMAAFSFLLLTAAPAQAQASRTWVSGVGDDANPCSRTAPCKTFAGAISKTANAGEINCLDSGGYGALTITKSITIRCTGVEAGVLVSGTNGFVVQAAATDVVTIDGLDFEGLGSAALSLNGIRFISGAALHIMNCTIQGFGSTNGTDGNGVAFVPTSTTSAPELTIEHTFIADNSNGGVWIKPGAGGAARVSIHDVQIYNNTSAGVRADAGNNLGTSGVSFTLDNVQVGGNGTGMFLFAPGTNTGPIKGIVAHSTIANNTSPGVLVNGTPITALFSDTTITNNLQGINATGGTVISYGDNRLFGNGSNNAFPTTIPKN